MSLPKTFQDKPYAAKHFSEIVDYARENNPFYRKWISDPDHVPIINRRIFLENNDEILNGHEASGSTSGSTGVPVRYVHSPQRARLGQRDVDQFVVELGGLLSCARLIYPHNKNPGPEILDIKSPISEQIDFILERRELVGVEAITSYPTNAEMLAREILNRGLDMSFIRRFGLFSENVESHQKQIIGKAFPNAKIWTSYSSMEFGLIASQCQHEPSFHHLMAHRLGVEVLREEVDEPAPVGERGRVVITDYFNRLSPFIRYELGDLAVRGNCPCGKTRLPALEKILGKVRGALVHRNGERVLFADLSVSLVNLPEIRQYQVIQETIEKFTVKVVSPINQDEKIQEAFMAHFGYLPDQLRIEYVEGIEKEKNGKFYASICRVEA
ncbi:MAG: phenylacetate--CoA ligase family protein [Verrucomicrobia bacterium]|nr:phenylacetate--CoA ligase family protein [Verrucomicrobiota bacterium]